jgi:hypothetical protein
VLWQRVGSREHAANGIEGSAGNGAPFFIFGVSPLQEIPPAKNSVWFDFAEGTLAIDLHLKNGSIH